MTKTLFHIVGDLQESLQDLLYYIEEHPAENIAWALHKYDIVQIVQVMPQIHGMSISKR